MHDDSWIWSMNLICLLTMHSHFFSLLIGMAPSFTKPDQNGPSKLPRFNKHKWPINPWWCGLWDTSCSTLANIQGEMLASVTPRATTKGRRAGFNSPTLCAIEALSDFKTTVRHNCASKIYLTPFPPDGLSFLIHTHPPMGVKLKKNSGALKRREREIAKPAVCINGALTSPAGWDDLLHL